MANLRTVSANSNQIVLVKGGAGNVGNVIGLVIFGILACVGLNTYLEQGGDFNPILGIVALVVGFALLNAVLGSVRSTRVIVDANQQRAARVESILFLPVKSQDMALNLIRDVRVSTRSTSPLARSAGSLPIWQVSLQGTDGSSLLLNDGGTRSEMQNLGQQVATLINRPLRDASQETTTAAPATSAPPTASEGIASLLGTLNAFTQSNSVPLSPTFSAYPTRTTPAASQTPPTQNRTQRQRRAAQRNTSNAPAQPPANTLVTPPTTFDSTPQYSDTTIPTTMPQSAMDLSNAATTPPVLYSAPPVLVLPELPALPSFAPALNMPSFAPIGSTTTPEQVTTIPDVEEIKEVQAQPVQTLPNNINELQRLVAQDPQNADAQYRLARRLYSTGNLRDAESAYQRALSVNPANAAVQNDLGVLYMQQGKWRHAETALRRAAALDPTAAPSRYNLGLVLLRTGGRGAAMEQFRVGAQAASAQDASYFQNAQNGNLSAPLSSPES